MPHAASLMPTPCMLGPGALIVTVGSWARVWRPARNAHAGMVHPHKVLAQICTQHDKNVMAATYKRIFEFLTGPTLQHALVCLYKSVVMPRSLIRRSRHSYPKFRKDSPRVAAAVSTQNFTGVPAMERRPAACFAAEEACWQRGQEELGGEGAANEACWQRGQEELGGEGATDAACWQRGQEEMGGIE